MGLFADDRGEHSFRWANQSGVTRFYCERWSGPSIWARAPGRMIAFKGGYLNTQDRPSSPSSVPPTTSSAGSSSSNPSPSLCLRAPRRLGHPGDLAHAFEGSPAFPDPAGSTSSSVFEVFYASGDFVFTALALLDLAVPRTLDHRGPVKI
jgi:hypothetical protein